MSKYITSLRIPSGNEFFAAVQEASWGEKAKHPEWSYARMPFFNGPEKYPAWLFPQALEFALTPVTIFYGGNGCGKSTILNLIAENLQIGRRSNINSSKFFKLFASFCQVTTHSSFDDINRRRDIITSDDVFQYCFKVRENNKEILAKQEAAIAEKVASLHGEHHIQNLHGLDDVERYSNDVKRRRRLQNNSFSGYLEKYVGHTFKPSSNGETALEFFTSAIDSTGLYLLDEPENSMSPVFQLKLLDFLQNSARYLGMQFIIATHSPLILGMEDATIYNLDLEGAPQCKWAELENIQILHNFFKEREGEFEE